VRRRSYSRELYWQRYLRGVLSLLHIGIDVSGVLVVASGHYPVSGIGIVAVHCVEVERACMFPCGVEHQYLHQLQCGGAYNIMLALGKLFHRGL
jgi:hypothetical protein